MRAAAIAAKGEGEKPDELITAQRCRAWACLPAGGGLLDQPAGYFARMTAALNVYETYRSWLASGDSVLYQEQSPDGFDLVQKIEKLLHEEE